MTGYGLDDGMIRVWFLVGAGNFSLQHCVKTGWGPPTLLSSGYWGVKWPGHEADHSPPSAKVKEW